MTRVYGFFLNTTRICLILLCPDFLCVVEPAKRALSIKPGVERGFASATPGSLANRCCEPAKRATEMYVVNLPPASQAEFFSLTLPGVALAKPRSTPGFMLNARFAGSTQLRRGSGHSRITQVLAKFRKNA